MSNDKSLVLTHFNLLTGDVGQHDIEAIAIQGKRIVSIGSLAEVTTTLPNDHDLIDLQGLTLSPGFIDLQINGCGGVNLNSAITEQTLDTMHATNLRFGCTSFLPTLITASDADIKEAIAVIARYRQIYPERVPGLHIEGPWLNPDRRGIHDQSLVRTPTPELVDYLCEHAEAIAKITLAPEMVEQSVITRLSDAGIIVSIGHSNATCAQVQDAEQAGARFVTHLHNAMSPLGSREPGVVGATFDSKQLCAGIIADGYHLSWENLRIAQRIMGDRLILVSDATAAAGSDIEQFSFGGQTVYHRSGKCVGVDGTLGGSALTMEDAGRNAVEHGITPEDAIRMATRNPAGVLGLEKELGVIANGAFANLVILDQDYRVRGTVSGGSLIWN